MPRMWLSHNRIVYVVFPQKVRAERIESHSFYTSPRPPQWFSTTSLLMACLLKTCIEPLKRRSHILNQNALLTFNLHIQSWWIVGSLYDCVLNLHHMYFVYTLKNATIISHMMVIMVLSFQRFNKLFL